MTGLMNGAFSDLLSFQRDLDRMFGREGMTGSFFSRGVAPAVNLFERSDDLVVTAELPGLKGKDVNIELDNGVLTISGERPAESKEGVSYHRRERDFGRFRRAIQLPYRVDPEKTVADFADGILTVTIGKAEEAKPRQITIR